MAVRYPLEMQQKQMQSLKQLQRLIMSPQMQQAIHLLQMPILELSSAITQEIEQNPVLELSEEDHEDFEEEQELDSEEENLEAELSFSDKDFEILTRLEEDFRGYLEEDRHVNDTTAEDKKRQSYLENSIVERETLYTGLVRQAQESFSNTKELQLSKELIGHLDQNGYLASSLEEISVLTNETQENLEGILKVIQTFEPFGVAARSLKESLLIQLRCLGKENTLAYQVVEDHYDNLLHNRLPLIQKGLQCTLEELVEVVDRHIAKLDFHPGAWFSSQESQNIVADVHIRQDGEQFHVEVNQDHLPVLRINSKYLRMLEDPELSVETKDFIKQKIVSAHWLMRNIFQRNDTLERICQALCRYQRNFLLEPDGLLQPLTMKAIAEELGVHESTVARGVSRKYAATPRGLMALRSFFTSALLDQSGESISSDTVRNLIRQLIMEENKRQPLSDDAIAAMIKSKGMNCARRTVAKYRKMLGLGNAHQRRKYS